MKQIEILAIVGSPNAGGRSLTAAYALLAGADQAGARTTVIELAAEPDPEQVQLAIEAADGVLISSPTYRARSSSLIKQVLENTQRGAYGESRSPLLGKTAAIVQTGASLHHFLAIDDLRDILAGFFSAQVLAPGLYLQSSDYLDSTTLTDSAGALAAAHGRAMAEFTAAVRSCPAAVALRSQV